MALDIAGGHPSGIHGDDLVIKTLKSGFSLGGNDRLEGAVSVTGNHDIALAKVSLALLLKVPFLELPLFSLSGAFRG